MSVLYSPQPHHLPLYYNLCLLSPDARSTPLTVETSRGGSGSVYPLASLDQTQTPSKWEKPNLLKVVGREREEDRMFGRRQRMLAALGEINSSS
jgi:hypothetical protein